MKPEMCEQPYENEKKVMNDQFAELTNGLARSVTRALLCLAVAALLGVEVRASNFKLGPLIQVSKEPDSLAGCDTGFRPPGNMNFADEFETRMAVDPTNTKHLVATWVG